MEPLRETIRIRVRFSEVDALRMVWHGCYMHYLEDAREAFGRRYGLTYLHIFDSGYVAPIADLHVQYRQPATIDDLLLVEITCRPTSGAKLVFDYRITKEQDASLVLTATTTQLFMTREGVFEPSSPEFFDAWKEKVGVQGREVR